MLRGGPSGFNNAPVTRTLVISSAILTVSSGLRGHYRRIGLSYQDIFENHKLWKTVPSVFAFSSSPELIIGLYLIYYFRVFERQIGSNKYSVFVLFSSVASTLLEIAALGLLKDSRVLASGPYGLIFASFIPFYFDIPTTSQFQVFGISFSDKSAIYFAGFQLLLYSWKISFIPSMCGVIAGLLFRTNVFGIRRIKFPKAITSSISRLFMSSSRSSTANIRRNVHVPNIGRQVQRIYPSHISNPEPPEASIATLVSMGFDRNAARRALMQARNDINMATNILLEAQTR